MKLITKTNITLAEAWAMSPRQISGYLKYLAAQEKRDAAQKLSLGAMAARGEPKEITKLLKEWEREDQR